MRTPFAVVAALMGSSLLTTTQSKGMSNTPSMSLAQASLESGVAEVKIKTHHEEFEDTEAGDDNQEYGHYVSMKEAEQKNDIDVSGKHKKLAKAAKQTKKHLHQSLAPPEPKKTKAQKALGVIEQQQAEADKARKAADAKAARSTGQPAPKKTETPVKSIDKLDGRIIILRGQHGPKYSFGQETAIKNDKEQIRVVAKPFDPKEKTQRFIWDARTKSFRLYHRKDFALSLYKGEEKEKFQLATLRKWINGPVQKGFQYNGHIILPWHGTKLCLQFTQFHPGSPLTWLPCRKTELQGFSIQLISFKTLRNNREKRIVVPHTYNLDQAEGHMMFFRGTHGPKYTIGHMQRIRKLSDERPVVTKAFNTKDLFQRWTWDKRSKSLRLFHQRHFALSFKLKQRRYGSPASIRLYKNELTQHHAWKGGKIHTEVNKYTAFCLGYAAVHPNAPVTWQACRKTPFQNFNVMIVTVQDKMRHTRNPRVESIITGTSEKEQIQKAKPLRGPKWSKKFFLQSAMSGGRRVFMSAQRDGEDSVAKIKKGENDWRSWFIYDERTKSIRLDAHRSLALSNRNGALLKVGKTVGFRKYTATADQTNIFFADTGKKDVYKITNHAKKCLTTQNYLNKDETLLQFWHCNKNPSQGWYRKLGVAPKKIKGKLWDTPFFIQSTLPGNRRIHQSAQKQGDDIILKFGKDITNWIGLFIVDQRTRSVRLHANRKLAISNQDTKVEKDRLKKGKLVVLRNFENTVDQRVEFNNKKFTNKARQCLTTKHYANKDDIELTWWKCNKNPSQNWDVKLFQNKQEKSFKGLESTSGPAAPRLPLNLESIDQQMIIVRGVVAPQYSLSYKGRIVPLKKVMPELEVVSKPYNMLDKSQQFVWEQRTRTLRPFHHRQYALSFDNHLGYFPGKFGSKAILRPFKKEQTQQLTYTGQIMTSHGMNKFCLNFLNLQPGSHFEWDACQRVNTQMFSINSITFMRKTKTGHKKIKHVKEFDTSTADGQTVLFRGLHGPRYTFGIFKRIRKQSDEPFIRTRVLNHKDVDQQFTWDTRTKSIRLFHKRDFCLSVRLAGNFATARIFKNEPAQQIRYDGRLHSKFRGTELHLTFNEFKPLSPLKWEPFDKKETQAIQVIIIQPRMFKRQNDRPRVQERIDSKGDHKFPEHVHKDTKPEPKWSKRFMLEQNGKGKRRLFMSKEVTGKDRVLKIDAKRDDWRAWFIYDARSRSIRLDAHRYLALSNKDSLNRFAVGKTVALRKWENTPDQANIHLKETSKKGVKNIQNWKRKCLTPLHFLNKDMNSLIWWNCNQNPAQGWRQIFKVPPPHPKGKIWENPFHIQTKDGHQRNLFMSNQVNGHDHIIKARKGHNDWKALFIVDKRSRSIRLHSDRRLAMSNQDSKEVGKGRMKKGGVVAMRQWKNQMDQEIWFDHAHIVNRNNQCLTFTNYVSKDENTVMFWKCNKNPTQNWAHIIYAIENKDPTLPSPILYKVSDKPIPVTQPKKGKAPAAKPESKPVVETPKKTKKLVHGKKVVNDIRPVGTAPKKILPLGQRHPLAIKSSMMQIKKLKREKEDAAISKMISEFKAQQAVEARKASASSLVQANSSSNSTIFANSTQPTQALSQQATQIKEQSTPKENVKETINSAGTPQPCKCKDQSLAQTDASGKCKC